VFLRPISPSLAVPFSSQPPPPPRIGRDRYLSKTPLVAALALALGGCSLDTVGLWGLRRGPLDSGPDTTEIDATSDMPLEAESDIPFDKIPESPPEDRVEETPFDGSTEDILDASDIVGEAVFADSVDSGLPEVAVDTGVDVPTDTGIDVGEEDVGVDVGMDVGIDTGVDVGGEIVAETGIDTGVDTGMDVRMDAGVDVVDARVEDVRVDVGDETLDITLPSPTIVYPRDGVAYQAKAIFSYFNYVPLSGRTFAGYRTCHASVPRSSSLLPSIDAAECSRQPLVRENSFILDPIASMSKHAIEVSACYFSTGADGGVYRCSTPSRVDFLTDDSVVLRLRMNGTADDSSGFMNHGILRGGAVFVTEPDWQALRCDGRTAYAGVRSSATLDLPEDFTISAQVRFNATMTPDNGAFVDRGIFEFYRRFTGTLALFMGGCGLVTSGGELRDDVKYYVDAIREGTTVSLYVNGEAVGSGICATNLTSPLDVRVGCRASTDETSCGEPFGGLVSDVTIARASSSRSLRPLQWLNDQCIRSVRERLVLAAECTTR